MLKIGKCYRTKNRFTKLFENPNTSIFITIGKGECFTVIDYITEEEEEDEFADFIVLYCGNKYCLSVKRYNFKAVGYDFEALC